MAFLSGDFGARGVALALMNIVDMGDALTCIVFPEVWCYRGSAVTSSVRHDTSEVCLA